MTYRQAIEFIYQQTPQFERIGAAAYKPGLATVTSLADSFGNPHRAFPVIHVAGTNGKGSTSHTLAAILQSAGYKVGLFTSPHLVDFRERIRVNGVPISHEGVVNFVESFQEINVVKNLAPSFFELTTIMAFDWFRNNKVDIAVVEVGLGGRLDSTNIVNPVLSIITNISFDHMAQLGNSLESIAREKAGIIKPHVPVVCGEDKPGIKVLLQKEALNRRSPISFACDRYAGLTMRFNAWSISVFNTPYGDLELGLAGRYQRTNIMTVLAAVDRLISAGYNIPNHAVASGFKNVVELTGFMGRWMKLADNPLVICDAGHNIGGWEYLYRQIAELPRPLAMVIGFVKDKDIEPILRLLPADARYFLTQPDIPRGLNAFDLQSQIAKFAPQVSDNQCFATVDMAFGAAIDWQKSQSEQGAVFVGGSMYVLAELLSFLRVDS